MDVAYVVDHGRDGGRAGRCGVDPEAGVVGYRRVCHRGVDAGGVAHRRAIERERVGGHRDAVVVALAGQDGVAETQDGRAGAAGVDGLDLRAADVQREPRRADHGDGLVEGDGRRDDVAGVQPPIDSARRPAERHGADRGHAGADSDDVLGAGRAGVAGEVGDLRVEAVGAAADQRRGRDLDPAAGEVGGRQRDRAAERGAAIAQLQYIAGNGVGARQSDPDDGRGVVGAAAVGHGALHVADVVGDAEDGGRGRRRGVDLIAGVGPGRAAGQDGVDAGGVADRRAVARQGVGRDRDAVAVVLAGLHRVGEGQRRGARAARVDRLHLRAADVERQRRRAAGRVDRHRLVEGHGGGDRIAGVERAVLGAGGPAERHGTDHRRRGVQSDRVGRARQAGVAGAVGHLGVELVGAAGRERGRRDVDMAIADVGGGERDDRAERAAAVAQLHRVTGHCVRAGEADAHGQQGVVARPARADRSLDRAGVVDDAGDRGRARRRRVDPEPGVVGERCVTGHGIHAGRVAHRRAVEVERVGGDRDAVGIGLPSLDGVAETQRRGAGAPGVQGLHRGATHLQREPRRAARGVDGDRLVERHGQAEYVADVHQAVLDARGTGQRDRADGGRGGVDGDRVRRARRTGVAGQVGQDRVQAVGAAVGELRGGDLDVAVAKVGRAQRDRAAQHARIVAQLQRVADGRTGAGKSHTHEQARIVGGAAVSHQARGIADAVCHADDGGRERGGRVDQEGGVARHRAVRQQRIQARHVAQRRTVGSQGSRRDSDAVRVGLAGLDGVGKGQRGRARAAVVGSQHLGAADVELQGRGAAAGVDRHRLVEADGGGDDVARIEPAIAQASGAGEQDLAHRRRTGVDRDRPVRTRNACVARAVGHLGVELVGRARAQHRGGDVDVTAGEVARVQGDGAALGSAAVAQLHRVAHLRPGAGQADPHHELGVVGGRTCEHHALDVAGVVGDRDDGGDAWRRGVDQEAGVGCHRPVHERSINPRDIAHRGTVEREGVGGYRDTVDVGLAGLYGVGKGQHRGAGAAGQRGLHRGAADVEGQRRRAAAHRHRLVEGDADREDIARVQGVVQQAGSTGERHHGDDRRARIHGDGMGGTGLAGVAGAVGQHGPQRVGAACGELRRRHIHVARGQVAGRQSDAAAQGTAAVEQPHRVAGLGPGAGKAHPHDELRVVGGAAIGHEAGDVAGVVGNAEDGWRRGGGRVDKVAGVRPCGCMGEDRIRARGVAQRGPHGQRKRIGRDPDAVSVGLCGEDGVAEGQGCRARAAGIGGLHRRAANVERERGRPADAAERDQLVEADGERHDVAGVEPAGAQAAGPGDRHGDDRRRTGVDDDRAARARCADVAGPVGEARIQCIAAARREHGGRDVDMADGQVGGAERDRAAERRDAVAQLQRIAGLGASAGQADADDRLGVVGDGPGGDVAEHVAGVVRDAQQRGGERRRGVHQESAVGGHGGVRQHGRQTSGIAQRRAVGRQRIRRDCDAVGIVLPLQDGVGEGQRRRARPAGIGRLHPRAADVELERRRADAGVDVDRVVEADAGRDDVACVEATVLQPGSGCERDRRHRGRGRVDAHGVGGARDAGVACQVGQHRIELVGAARRQQRGRDVDPAAGDVHGRQRDRAAQRRAAVAQLEDVTDTGRGAEEADAHDGLGVVGRPAVDDRADRAADVVADAGDGRGPGRRGVDEVAGVVRGAGVREHRVAAGDVAYRAPVQRQGAGGDGDAVGVVLASLDGVGEGEDGAVAAARVLRLHGGAADVEGERGHTAGGDDPHRFIEDHRRGDHVTCGEPVVLDPGRTGDPDRDHGGCGRVDNDGVRLAGRAHVAGGVGQHGVQTVAAGRQGGRGDIHPSVGDVTRRQRDRAAQRRAAAAQLQHIAGDRAGAAKAHAHHGLRVVGGAALEHGALDVAQVVVDAGDDRDARRLVVQPQCARCRHGAATGGVADRRADRDVAVQQAADVGHLQARQRPAPVRPDRGQGGDGGARRVTQSDRDSAPGLHGRGRARHDDVTVLERVDDVVALEHRVDRDQGFRRHVDRQRVGGGAEQRTIADTEADRRVGAAALVGVRHEAQTTGIDVGAADLLVQRHVSPGAAVLAVLQRAVGLERGDAHRCQGRALDVGIGAEIAHRQQARHVLLSQDRIVARDGRVIDRGHGERDDVNGAGEGGRAAVRRRVDLLAGAAGGLVPGAEGQRAGDAAVEVGGGLEVHARLAVGLQQQRLRRPDRAGGDPVRAAVGAVVQRAVHVDARDGDAPRVASVGIGHAADEISHRQTDGARRRAGVLGQRRQPEHRVGQDGGVVAASDAGAQDDGRGAVSAGAAVAGDVEGGTADGRRDAAVDEAYGQIARGTGVVERRQEAQFRVGGQEQRRGIAQAAAWNVVPHRLTVGLPLPAALRQRGRVGRHGHAGQHVRTAAAGHGV